MEAPGKRRWTRAEEAAFLRAKRPWLGAHERACAQRCARGARSALQPVALGAALWRVRRLASRFGLTLARCRSLVRPRDAQGARAADARRHHALRPGRRASSAARLVARAALVGPRRSARGLPAPLAARRGQMRCRVPPGARPPLRAFRFRPWTRADPGLARGARSGAASPRRSRCGARRVSQCPSGAAQTARRRRRGRGVGSAAPRAWSATRSASSTLTGGSCTA